MPAGVYSQPFVQAGIGCGNSEPWLWQPGAVGGVVKMSRVGSAVLGSGLFQTQCLHSLTMGTFERFHIWHLESPDGLDCAVKGKEERCSGLGLLFLEQCCVQNRKPPALSLSSLQENAG